MTNAAVDTDTVMGGEGDVVVNLEVVTDTEDVADCVAVEMMMPWI